MKEKHLLALDIGTRKITGLLLVREGDVPVIKAVETLEHQTRAMLDGQIHDIPKVAEAVLRVCHDLEKQTGFKAKAAAVAAAGRALSTARASATIPVQPSKRILQEEILRLEYAAVQRAQQEIYAGPAGKACFAEQYHCVGYSVARYYLDGSPIGNLLGQRGSSAGCEVIATFLPRVVVDSLRSVLEASGLKLQSLTLEPIAALRMVVPENLRRLNLALVDIGAGTSDIAITRDGTVFAYDMVPVAGDEVTEALCQQYLLDFMAAESLKRKLVGDARLTFTNIIGKKIVLTPAEIRHSLATVLEDLGEKIACSILRHNGSAPQAVFCVGGGSLVPGLTDIIAAQLGLEPARVTIKGKETLSLLPGRKKGYKGPELVTPLGIAYTAMCGESMHFYRVTVDDQPVDVMDLGRGSVADALLAAGIVPRQLVGPPGKGLSVEVNGGLVTIPGEMGEMARIFVNGEDASLETPVGEGDKISFQPARPGADARATVADLLARISPFKIYLNGEEWKLVPPVYRGDVLLEPSAVLNDRDSLRILKTMPLYWVLNQVGREQEIEGGSIRITVNGEERHVAYGPKIFRVNGQAAVHDTPVSHGDRVEICFDGEYPVVGDLTKSRTIKIELLVNGQAVVTPVKEVRFLKNGREVKADAPLYAGDAVEIIETNYEVTMADILNLIGFKTTPPAGKNRLILRVNGREAQFTTAIQDGDRLEVGWSA